MRVRGGDRRGREGRERKLERQGLGGKGVMEGQSVVATGLVQMYK